MESLGDLLTEKDDIETWPLGSDILSTRARAVPKSPAGVSLTDFYAFMPSHSYIYIPTREMWPATSVNARILPIPLMDEAGQPILDDKKKEKKQTANQWLDRHRPVEQMTWAPGEPICVTDRLVSDGGWIPKCGVSCFNLYRPPITKPGDKTQAARWVDHVRFVYPGEADHIIKWLAHRVQFPQQKINHAIVMGGAQGIGKDTILEPVKAAIGPWNFAEVSPQHLLGRFNGFVKSVILRVSEARDLGDVDRFAFYDHMKTYTAAPPDVLRVDEKNLREYAVFNVCGVIITTNHKTDGIYLPPDDRRHFVAWSECTRDEFPESYWTDLYKWFGSGGLEHVTAYLAAVDLSDFNAKAPPPKTEAFWTIVDSNRSPDEAELEDALEKMMHPAATTIAQIAEYVPDGFRDFLLDQRNARKIPHRLEDVGYVMCRNPDAQNGLWRVNGRKVTIYARNQLSPQERIVAARKLTEFRSR